MNKPLVLTEAEERELMSVVDFFNDEDKPVRERQIITWKRLKLMWEGMSNIYFSSVAHDWRVFPLIGDGSGDTGENSDQAYYDKRVNVFRAYLESICAALSVVVPPVKCFPDDAENSLDLLTARTGDKIGELIFRHNDMPLLWLHGLFIFCTEGMVACHTRNDAKKEYGTYSKETKEEITTEHELTKCPHCGYTIDDNQLSPEQSALPIQQPMPQPTLPDPNQMDMGQEGMGDSPEDEAMLQQLEQQMGMAPQPPMPPSNGMGVNMEGVEDTMGQGQDICPSCQQMMTPEVGREHQTEILITGITDEPKSRVCMDFYGGLYVKVPNYARNQADIPYLRLEREINVVMAVEKYEKLKTKNVKEFINNIKGQGGENWDEYEQWGRLSPQYRGEFPDNTVTEAQTWLRPAAFNYLDTDRADFWKKKCPDGVVVAQVNDTFCAAKKEALDEHWTLINNPMSDYIHFDPLGTSLTSIQEITVDMISLILQTIEHGIGQTFADPNVLDFKAYEQTEVLPGGIFPAIPKGGKGLNDAFHEIKTATLSQEVLPFANFTQQMGQLASGAQPTIFGGQLEGSETASEYSMSRAQSLQRLQNTWKMFTTWWKYVNGKAINLFIDELEYDERDVQRRKDGSFFNVLIKQSELQGKIGKVELEANENLPLTWSQQKDVIMNLLNSTSPMIQQFIMAPENLPIVREAIGLTDFFVPGEEDVEKQYEEIQLLLESEPIPNQMAMDPNAQMQAAMSGQPMEEFTSSVPVEPEIDNHVVQFEICRAWLISAAGRQAKSDNSKGYENVLLHAKEHLLLIPPPVSDMAPAGKGATPGEKPSKASLQDAPITGENNVKAVN